MSKDSGNRVHGIMIAEGSYSFILTFVAYNNATLHPKEGILVDRVIESDFERHRKIVIQFDTPIILSRHFE